MESTKSKIFSGSDAPIPRIIKHLKASNQPNQLQKMYLLTEPAFRRYKQEVDEEKYLSSLDREMKKVLRQKTHNYKKWIMYSNLLRRYFDFKKFMDETKQQNDTLAATNFMKLAEKSKQLAAERANVRVSTPQKQHSIVDLTTGPPSVLKKSLTPPLNSSTPKALTPALPNITPLSESNLNSVRKQLFSDLPQPAVEDVLETSSILNDSDEISGNFMLNAENSSLLGSDTSDTRQKHFEDIVLTKETLRRRLEALPPLVKQKFLTNNIFPVSSFKIEYVDPVTEEEVSHKINSLDVVILGPNKFKKLSQNGGYRTYEVPNETALHALRAYLVGMHDQIDQALEGYQQLPANEVNIRPYSVVEHKTDKDKSVVRYKRKFVSVPKVLLPEIFDYLNEVDLTPEEFKAYVHQKVDKYNSDHVGNQKRISKTNTSQAVNQTLTRPIDLLPSMATFNQQAAQLTSTPETTKSRKRANLHNTSLTDYYKKIKNASIGNTSQAEKMEWERI